MNFNRVFARTASSFSTMALAICTAFGTASVSAQDKEAKPDGPKAESPDKGGGAIATPKEVGQKLSDSAITAKVKAALLKEPELKSLDVSVETKGGEVLLSGFVKDEGQRQKAMRAAVAVQGVGSVKDLMLVR